MLARGACMVAGEGVHGCRGVCGCGGHAWLLGACVVAGGMHRIRRDMVNEQAVRILLECILVCENVLNEEIQLYRAMERNSTECEHKAVVDLGFPMGRGS